MPAIRARTPARHRVRERHRDTGQSMLSWDIDSPCSQRNVGGVVESPGHRVENRHYEYVWSWSTHWVATATGAVSRQLPFVRCRHGGRRPCGRGRGGSTVSIYRRTRPTIGLSTTSPAKLCCSGRTRRAPRGLLWPVHWLTAVDDGRWARHDHDLRVHDGSRCSDLGDLRSHRGSDAASTTQVCTHPVHDCCQLCSGG